MEQILQTQIRDTPIPLARRWIYFYHFWELFLDSIFLSQIALIQRTAAGKKVTSPLGKKLTKPEPDANFWRKMTLQY